jgi:hypothetical protein
MFVRSPTLTNSESSSTTSGSRPDRRSAGRTCGGVRGARPSTVAAIAAMCAGVVPQQPPTMLTKPASANSSRTAAVSSGDSSYSPNALGRPAFG